ncbi:MAG: hypothetical protein LC132_02855 [Burkholderiales bacterium]|nr:hypothetical protein [Burkholderiales bacterium]
MKREYFFKSMTLMSQQKFHMEIAKISGNAYLARFISTYMEAALYIFFDSSTDGRSAKAMH